MNPHIIRMISTTRISGPEDPVFIIAAKEAMENHVGMEMIGGLWRNRLDGTADMEFAFIDNDS